MRKAALLAKVRLAAVLARLDERATTNVIVRASDVRELLAENDRLVSIVLWCHRRLPAILQRPVGKMLAGEGGFGDKKDPRAG